MRIPQDSQPLRAEQLRALAKWEIRQRDYPACALIVQGRHSEVLARSHGVLAAGHRRPLPHRQDHALRQRDRSPGQITSEQKYLGPQNARLQQLSPQAMPLWRAQNLSLNRTGMHRRKRKDSHHRQHLFPEHDIILFPDLDATEKWIAKADEIPALKNAKVSTWLEKHSTPEEKLQGLDIGDYLVRLPAWRKLRLKDFI